MISTATLRRTTAAAAALLCGLALAPLPAAAQTRVGVNTAVNPDAIGSGPGAAPRRLTLGQRVVYNERVATSAAGQTQIAFLDESTMSVGPNSDLVIDRFVYDPQRGAGQIAVTATRGVFRYIGGHISKNPNAVSIRTPSAMVGIRGGVFLLQVRPNGGIDAIFVYGIGLTVTGLDGITQVASRPGYEISVAAPGAAPSAPYPAPAGAIGAILAQLDGQPGRHGGARRIPASGFAGYAPPPVPTQIAGSSGDFGSLPPIFLAGPQLPTRRPQPEMPSLPTPSPVVNPVVSPVGGVNGPAGVPTNFGR